MLRSSPINAPSSSHAPSKMHYFLDVDDTLMVNNGTLVFNDNLIKKLKEYGVTTVTLLTRMDAKNYGLRSSIRLPLIEHLSKQGITVNCVLTPLDMLFKDAGYEDFNPGDTYEKFIKPVDEALVKINMHLNNDPYMQYHANLQAIKVLNYLIQNNLINGKSPINSLNGCINEKPNKIETHIYHNHHEGFVNVDYYYIFEGLPGLLNHYIKRGEDLTLIDLISNLEKNLHVEKEKLPLDPQENVEKIANFNKELTIYRNRLLHANLSAINAKYKENLSTLESKSELEIKPEKSEYTKGQVYTWYVNECKFDKKDIIIFIDDSEKEHTSVQNAHKENKFEHSLKITLPPQCKSDFNLGMDVDNFNKFIYICNMLHKLNMHLAGHEIDENLRKEYIKYFNNNAESFAENNKNLQAAILYFEIAYLFCNAKLTEDKKLIIENAIAAKNNYQKDHETLDVSEFDELRSNLKETCGFNFMFRMLSLAVDIHQIKYPFIYKGISIDKYKSKLISTFFSSSNNIYPDFKNKIIGETQRLADTYPDKRPECIIFLSGLLTQLSNKLYINDVMNAIGDLTTKINLVPETKLVFKNTRK